ncbi:hypothetical protein MVEN_00787900 [Mycena venus]|uniref:Uncharacterized protein n=1 Tax=Mycena venus TaxID=2733690 RepID=A0A8H7D6G4_9AGAR|nr:hypothetical protein MVEN_00787900 [Mycena venus]
MTIAPGTKESYIGVFLENIVYGVYLSVFFESSLLLWRKQQTRNVKQIYVIVTSALMFILITMRCVIDTIRCIVAFNTDGLDFGPPNTTMGIITNAAWFVVLYDRQTLEPTNLLYFAFRLRMRSSSIVRLSCGRRNYFVIILPTLLFLANFASSIWLIYSIVKFDPTKPVFGELTKSVNAFIYLTLFTNVICTGLISFRIFSVRRNVAGMVSTGSRSDGVTSKIVSIIVESAAIYTLMLIGQLITNRLGSFVNYIVVNCTPATIGLVFSYIIIRVSRGSSYGDSTGNVNTSLSRERRANGQTFELSQTRNNRSGTRSEVQVKLERVVHQHSDMDSASKDSESNIGKYPDGSVV